MNKDKLPHQFKLPIWRDKTNASFCFKFTELHTLMKSTIVNSNTLVSPRNKIQLATPLNSKIQSHIICYHYIYNMLSCVNITRYIKYNMIIDTQI